MSGTLKQVTEKIIQILILSFSQNAPGKKTLAGKRGKEGNAYLLSTYTCRFYVLYGNYPGACPMSDAVLTW